jgi:hypothetical protein
MGTVTVGGNSASTIANLSGAIAGTKNAVQLGSNAAANNQITFNVAGATLETAMPT